jgi:penicillin V acylase-like amidase (Ntn superfamily)
MIPQLLKSLLIVAVLVPPLQACTAFVVYRNGLALAGNNEDFWLTDTKVWYVPKEGSQRGVAGELGRVYFGFDNFYPQGGMNEAGLFFDGFATSENKITKSDGKPRFAGNISDHVMAHCKTVEEVVAVFEKYDLSFLSHAMLMFADQHGDSVIIEGDEFLRIEGDHQVVTNFYQSLTSPDKYSCPRYLAAVRSLGPGEPLSINSCRDVLAATRQARSAPTQYSNVYNLKQGLVYLYHFHNFEEVVCIDLKEELAKGAHETDLPTLFSENEQFTAFKSKREQEILRQTEARRAKNIDADTIKEFVGIYLFDVGLAQKVIANFWLEDDRFYVVSAIDNQREQIYPEAPDLFFRIGDYGPQTYKFSRNDAGQVTGVTVKVFGRTYQGTKADPGSSVPRVKPHLPHE